MDRRGPGMNMKDSFSAAPAGGWRPSIVARVGLAEPEHDLENHLERDRPHRVFDGERPIARPACRELAGDPGDDRAIVLQSSP